MNRITFRALRPGAWLRDDVADILTALSNNAPDKSYQDALCDAATALGLYAQRQQTQTVLVMIDGEVSP